MRNLLLLIFGLGLAYVIASTATHAIAGSMDQSAQILANASGQR